MKVIVDLDACCSYGVCIETDPELFSFGEDDTLRIAATIPLEHEEKARFACRACPAQALQIEE